jgi:hypothetical protein
MRVILKAFFLDFCVELCSHHTLGPLFYLVFYDEHVLTLASLVLSQRLVLDDLCFMASFFLSWASRFFFLWLNSLTGKRGDF